MESYFKRVADQTPTRFWINNVTQEEAALAIEAGAVGSTQNPSYCWKMLTDEGEKPRTIEILRKILADEPDDNKALVRLQRELVTAICRIFEPMYTETGGKLGYVSIQGDPFLEDTDSIVEFARFHREAAPNIMAKIPVTADGLKAIEILAREGVPINATEVMSVRQALDVCDVYVKATKGISNPPIIYFSHIAGIFDEYLSETVNAQNIDVNRDALWQAGIIVAKKIHEIVAERCYPVGFIGGGARGLHHFTEMVGGNASITINWKGTADKLIESDPPVVQRFLAPVPHSVLEELLSKLPDFYKAYIIDAIDPEEYEHYGPVVKFRSMFEDAWIDARKEISQYRSKL